MITAGVFFVDGFFFAFWTRGGVARWVHGSGQRIQKVRY